MIKTTHLRAPVASVLELVDAALSREGFRRVELPPNVPLTMRRVVVAEQDGWTAVGDDPFASTPWGEHLSAGIPGTPVFTLEGECDHAFYSSVVVHEDGTETHSSGVPADAVAGADGRHRIHPQFLAHFFPEAATALDEGIVIHRLGGEGNVRAVADVLGIPNALLGPGANETAGVTTLAYEYDADAEVRPPADASVLGGLLGNLAKQLGIEGDLSAIMPKLVKSFIPRVHVDAPLTLEAPSSSRERGFAGNDHRSHTTFQLHGGKGERAEGMTVRVSGSCLEIFDVKSIAIVTMTTLDRAETDALPPERIGDALVVTVPSFALEAEAIVYVSGRLLREGKGDLVLHGETTVNGEMLVATSHNHLEVVRAPRRPVLPAWVSADALVHEQHTLEEYEKREHASGWLAIDRAWSDVGHLVVRMGKDLTAMLLEIQRSEPRRETVVVTSFDEAAMLAALDRGADVIVEGPPRMRATLSDDRSVYLSSMEDQPPPGFRAEVLRKGGERLEFPDVPWEKLVPELERGADVTLVSGPYMSEVRVEIVHQPEGSNHFPDPSRTDDYARVQLAWTCPRPEAAGSRVSLGRASADLLTRAGAIDGQLGGFADASGTPLRGPGFDAPYGSLVGTQRASGGPAWLRTHVKTPAYQVLVPPGLSLAESGPGEVVQTRLAHGMLLSSPASDPFVYDATNAEAMERLVLPRVGEPE